MPLRIAGMQCQSAVDIQYQTCQRLIARENRSELFEHSRRIDYLVVLSRVYVRCQELKKLVRRGPSRKRKGKGIQALS
jgi:hypothetical protein